MKKKILTLFALVASLSCFAQYSTNYYDLYGKKGTSNTQSSYGGGTTTIYYDQYGNRTGSKYSNK